MNFIMRNNLIKISAVSMLMLTASFNASAASEQSAKGDVDLFCYSKADGKSGLRLAWSEDGKNWNSICSPKSESKSGWNFVNSDFGPWGSHKTMFSPRIYKTDKGWMAVWYVSDKFETLACGETTNFINWTPQRYAEKSDSCKLGFCDLTRGAAVKENVAGREFTGEVIKVPRQVVEDLIGYMDKRAAKQELESAQMKDDAERFKSLKPLTGSLGINPYAFRRISDKLIGIFFEDINYSADGGLYAELVQNRDFEYKYEDSHKKDWGPGYSWKLSDGSGNDLEMQFDTASPIHENNPTYLKVNAKSAGLSLSNEGFDGISLKKGDNYLFSMFVRNSEKSKKSGFVVKLCDTSGKTVAQSTIQVQGTGWKKVSTTLTVDSDVKGGKLVVDVNKGDICDLDMISLFPENTYNGRQNGLRKDLASVLADLKPRFVRFPGGCLAHGDGIDNIYDWKGSIGPLEARKPLRNIWNYHQTRGLGYYEYFLMCEDLGAEPLPVLAAGVPCQNSGSKHAGSHNEITSLGQQCGIPMEDMDKYTQDILDLIEYANGPADSYWGSKRAEAGHPKPFNLKYIGIGNEDMITDVFKERFKYINDILKEKHPEITVIGTVGPFYEGSDYEEGWKFAKEEHVPMVDEHYYVEPGWFLNNRNFYDNYDRSAPHVYLGEYASHLPSRDNTLETALTIGLYLTDVERNADVVEMTSYAPLLAKEKHINWRPDMIFFTNDSINLTPDYYVQQMYGQNSGSLYIPSRLELSDKSADVTRRVGASVVMDESTGDVIVKIANLLPVEIQFNEDLSEYGIMEGEVEATILSGKPEEKCTKPYNESVKIEEGIFSFTAKPYSLSVIRVPGDYISE